MPAASTINPTFTQNTCRVPDKIRQLPDHVANQIAAGEVIQRPASAVKELLENALDAGATDIQLILKDAGKELVQLIDNGSGMSPEDARMCFGRHATSKIQEIEDLQHIRTMGFRGEALAAMAAVAQMNLKTRTAESESGWELEIENSQVVRESACAMNPGTVMSMKNLFFNVPARRHFLKSNATEMRHNMEAFISIAMAHPDLAFSMHHNQQELYHLTPGSLKQRIVQLLGSSYSSKLIGVQEHNDYLSIQGFVGKPEAAKRSRGDQYFFVNGRYIRSHNLHHGVMQAFSHVLAPDAFPAYILFLDLDPKHMDVNVHPSKQEVKFDDERIIHAFVSAAVRHALGTSSITPSLDFDLDPSIQHLPAVSRLPSEQDIQRSAQSSLYQGFTRKNQAHLIDKSTGSSWKDLYASALSEAPFTQDGIAGERHSSELWNPTDTSGQSEASKIPIQVHRRYILQQIKSGLILIDQHIAHEKILYEELMQSMQARNSGSRQLLFPETLEVSLADAELLRELMPDLELMGYRIEPQSPGIFHISACPALGEELSAEAHILERLIEHYKTLSAEAPSTRREHLIRNLAKQKAIKANKALNVKEMQNIIDRLFACSQPQVSADGRPTYITLQLEDLQNLFNT